MTLQYETKCRRCGGLHQWAFMACHENHNSPDNWILLHKYVSEHLSIPSVNNCSVCMIQTIQDYVSYTSKGG